MLKRGIPNQQEVNFKPGPDYRRIATDVEIEEGLDHQKFRGSKGKVVQPPVMPEGYPAGLQGCGIPEIEKFNRGKNEKDQLSAGDQIRLIILDGLLNDMDNLSRVSPHKVKLTAYKQRMVDQSFPKEVLDAIDQPHFDSVWNLYVDVFGKDKWAAQAAALKESLE